MNTRRLWTVTTSLLLAYVGAARGGRAQDGSATVSVRQTLTSVAVPYDPLEMVPNNAREVTNAEERAATLALLEKAKQLSNVRLHSYDLKTSFTAYGTSGADERWILEDMSPGGSIYRWTAQGPSFSGIFLTVDKLLSSNWPSGAMPLRLAQVRDTMWDIYDAPIGPAASVRVGDGSLAGAPVHCVLVDRSYGRWRTPFASGRSFDESEYCVNPQTGLLETYSPYAGMYIRFDYANGLHFHEQTLPDGFTVTEHGKTVIQAKTESVGEAPPRTSDVFSTAGLNPLGVGQTIVGPMLIWGYQTSPLPGAAGQAVVVRGMSTPQGKVTDLEVLASTNESLNATAIEHAQRARGPQLGSDEQAGATPEARQVVFTVAFAPRSGVAQQNLPTTTASAPRPSLPAQTSAAAQPPAPARSSMTLPAGASTEIASPAAPIPPAAPPSSAPVVDGQMSADQQQQFDEARKFFGAQQYAAALPIFKNLMAERPGDTVVAKFASEAAVNVGDLAFALGALQPIAQADPNDWQAAVLLTRACAESENIPCRDAGMAHVQDLFSRGVTPKGMLQYPVERISVGANSLLLWTSLEPWGPYKTYARGQSFDAQGKMFLQITLESADFDQIEFVKEHPQEAAEGIRQFSLDSYLDTGTNSAGQRTQTQSLYKFFDGQPAYDAVRQEFVDVASGKDKPIMGRTGLVVP